MRKILSLLLASTIACSAAACDFVRGDDEIDTTATEENADSTTAPNEELVQAELKAYIASLSCIKVVFNSLDISDWTAAPIPPTGK